MPVAALDHCVDELLKRCELPSMSHPDTGSIFDSVETILSDFQDEKYEFMSSSEVSYYNNLLNSCHDFLLAEKSDDATALLHLANAEKGAIEAVRATYGSDKEFRASRRSVAYHLLGRILTMARDYEGAHKAINNSIRSNPFAILPRFTRVEILLGEGKFSSAIRAGKNLNELLVLPYLTREERYIATSALKRLDSRVIANGGLSHLWEHKGEVHPFEILPPISELSKVVPYTSINKPSLN